MTSSGDMGRPSLYICHVEKSVTSTSGANSTQAACTWQASCAHLQVVLGLLGWQQCCQTPEITMITGTS